MQMQFGLGNLFNKKVTLQESGIVPDVFPEMFDEKTVLRVKYPAWVKSAVDLTSVASFGGTPTRGVGEVVFHARARFGGLAPAWREIGETSNGGQKLCKEKTAPTTGCPPLDTLTVIMH